MLAPFEHRAFAREYVQDNPLSFPSMMVAPYAYALAKLLRTHGSRTRPSMEQVFAGQHGAVEGIQNYFNKEK